MTAQHSEELPPQIFTVLRMTVTARPTDTNTAARNLLPSPVFNNVTVTDLHLPQADQYVQIEHFHNAHLHSNQVAHSQV